MYSQCPPSPGPRWVACSLTTSLATLSTSPVSVPAPSLLPTYHGSSTVTRWASINRQLAPHLTPDTWHLTPDTPSLLLFLLYLNMKYISKAPAPTVRNTSVLTERTGLLSSFSVLVIPAQDKLVIKCVASILVGQGDSLAANKLLLEDAKLQKLPNCWKLFVLIVNVTFANTHQAQEWFIRKYGNSKFVGICCLTFISFISH